MALPQQPIAAKYNRLTKLTTLYFDTVAGRKSHDYYVMGSVSWPEGMMDGFALLAGQDQHDGRIQVYREYTFKTVDHWILPNGELKQHGFLSFLADAWKDFQCRSFYYHQDEEVHRRYSLEVYQCDRIAPKPEFIRVLYSGQEIGDNVIDEMGRLQKLPLNTTLGPDGKPNSKLYQGLIEYRTMRDAEPNKAFVNEAVHALRCLLGGYVFNKPPRPRENHGLIELPWVKRIW